MTPEHLERCAAHARSAGLAPALVVPTGATKIPETTENVS